MQVLDAAVPFVVAVVIVVVGIVRTPTNVDVAGLALGIAAAAALAGRRRFPGWTLVTSGVLVVILLHLDPALGAVAVLAPAVALFAFGLIRDRRHQIGAAIVASAMVVVAEILAHGRSDIGGTVAHVALVAIPLLAAETLRTRRSYVSLLLERLALAEQSREHEAARRVEQERMRIARELHDIVAHTLTTINVQAAVAGHLVERDPQHAAGALALIEEASREAIAELRAVLGVLRDPEDEASRAPAPGVDDVADLVQRVRDTGLDALLQITGVRPALISGGVSLAAYRIVQESLTNARRHAAGAPVRVRLCYDHAELVIAVENGVVAGASPPPQVTGAAGGVGIIGMTERAQAVGGSLRTASTADGFRVDATLPYLVAAP